MTEYDYQYCQKIVLFSEDLKTVLLCRRKGESDYDGVYSFIGGKMEHKDGSFIEGLKREKGEEIGEACEVEVYPLFATHVFFRKKSSDYMVLPHFFARFLGGEIRLNEEYSDSRWVALDELDAFEPKIPGIGEMAREVLKLTAIIRPGDMVRI